MKKNEEGKIYSQLIHSVFYYYCVKHRTNQRDVNMASVYYSFCNFAIRHHKKELIVYYIWWLLQIALRAPDIPTNTWETLLEICTVKNLILSRIFRER